MLRRSFRPELTLSLLAALGGLYAAPSLAEAPIARVAAGPTARPVVSVPLGSLRPVLTPAPYVDKVEDRVNPLAHEADQGRRGTWNRATVPADPLAAHGLDPRRRTPTPFLTFAGTGNPTGCSGCSPPDTVGDVGPNHYVQLVNATKIAVYSKAGALLGGPFNLSDFWPSGNCSGDAGDPVVAYDPLAERWVLAQFADPNDLCFAVSTTSNPLGTYFTYDFSTTDFPDYFKLSVWPDGYYVSTNENVYSAWAFERPKMLQGLAAQSVKAAASADNFLLASDLDGLTPPPAGSPALFYTFLDDTYHGGVDRLALFNFHVDWVTLASSTFTALPDLPVAAFTYTVCGFFSLSCVPQSSTTRKVDAVSEWPMFRFTYRNFGTYESLVGNYTVNVSSRAAPRWFELRRSGGAWSLAQEGTYDPGAVGFRFMGSTAQDRNGDLALGYTHSSATDFPSLRIATRLPTDTAGTLGAEAVLIAGTGSQTGSNRWGDYSAMSIDPADDCTFWYTSEYYPASASSTWKTRIGAFRVPGCDALFFDNFETGGITRWNAASP